MLEEILRHLHNWFVLPDGIHHGVFKIDGNKIDLPFLNVGQYFRIIGSVFNDGLYRYGDPASDFMPEEFDGTVWALAVPKSVVSLSGEIAEWIDKNGNASPFSSESFGGYSYSRATNANGDAVGWKDVFKSRLNPYRKIG